MQGMSMGTRNNISKQCLCEKSACKIGAIVVSCFSMIIRLRNSAVFTQIKKEVNAMREGIHPNYQQTTIRCACGAVIETGSTKKDIKVEICSKCHPFYTGKQKLVNSGGRIERFNKKFGLK